MILYYSVNTHVSLKRQHGSNEVAFLDFLSKKGITLFSSNFSLKTGHGSNQVVNL